MQFIFFILDIDDLKDEAVVKPKRKTLRSKIKTKKCKRQKKDVLTKEMLNDAQRLKKKLKAMQDIGKLQCLIIIQYI